MVSMRNSASKRSAEELTKSFDLLLKTVAVERTTFPVVRASFYFDFVFLRVVFFAVFPEFALQGAPFVFSGRQSLAIFRLAFLEKGSGTENVDN